MLKLLLLQYLSLNIQYSLFISGKGYIAGGASGQYAGLQQV
jgi:hypothetical protein